MLKMAIQKVVDGKDLGEEEMEAAMDVIMSGEATPAQIGAFITALRLKGETIEEIAGAARVMRRKATRIAVDNSMVPGRHQPGFGDHRRYLRDGG